jgi:hypothetical protein
VSYVTEHAQVVSFLSVVSAYLLRAVMPQPLPAHRKFYREFMMFLRFVGKNTGKNA